MRHPGRYPLLLLLLLMVSCGGFSRRNKATTPPAPLGREVVITDTMLSQGGTDTLRLGRMASGEQLLLNFHLRNRASQPVVVVGEELTCGCIALSYERKPVRSGEHLPIEMRFDSRGLYGWQLKLFRLHLNGDRNPLQIYVEAEIE